MNDLEL